MRNHYKTLAAALLVLVLVVRVPFIGVSQAHAAQQQDTSQVFTKCMEKGAIASLAAKAVTTLLGVFVTTITSTAVIKEAARVATSVPTQNLAAAAVRGNTSAQNTAANVWNTKLKPFFDQLGYVTGQCALEQLTANTISWIKGGFHGSPSFAVNPKQLFLDLEASVADQLSRQVIDTQLTDFIPGFSNNLTKSIQLSTRVDAQGKFSAKIKSTLPTYIDPPAFYQDFNKGGWGAYGASLQTNNNPFGIMIIVGDELAARQLAAQTQKKEQLDWSQGYIDIVDTNKCTYKEATADEAGIYLGADGQPDPKEYTPSEIKTIQEQYCPITTPGNIIANQLTKTLGTDMDRLGFADDMNKIITALISKLVQDTVKSVF